MNDLRPHNSVHSQVSSDDQVCNDSDEEIGRIQMGASVMVSRTEIESEVPERTLLNFTLVQLVLVSAIFAVIFTDAVIVFPLFIILLIPLRAAIKEFAFSDKEHTLSDRKWFSCATMHNFLSTVFQFVFATKNLERREEYLKMIDPLVGDGYDRCAT